jgi:hypothetical protein
MPLPRGRDRVAKQMGRYTGTLADWSRKWCWNTRIEAWDAHMEERKIRAPERAVEKMNEEHAFLAMTGLKKVLQRFTGDDVEGVTAIDPSKLSAQDLARLTEVLSKLERLARGSETERVANDVQHQMPKAGVRSDTGLRTRL